MSAFAFLRSELSSLEAWLFRPLRQPLIIRGARQVGKSTLVHMLAKKSGFKLIEIDFEKDPAMADLFTSKNPSQIISLLEAILNTDILIAQSLLFLDEVQRVPAVLSCLRYFFERMPELAVIATGSLLDFTLNESHYSIPVGRVEYFFLGPITFEGFLRALDKTVLLTYLQNISISSLSSGIPLSLHAQLLELLKLYFFIGGMPQAIATYIQTQSLLEVSRVKQSLVLSYQDDFSKYYSGKMQQRLRLLFQKISFVLGEKFKYVHIDKEDKSTYIKEALDHLQQARLVHLVYHSSARGVPLGAQANHKDFKSYFLDIGLVLSILGISYDNFALDTQHMSLVNIGQISEQFVAQQILQNRPSFEEPQLYYWLREEKSSSAEVDFVISLGGEVLPIEVKSGKAGTLKSLHIFMQERNLKKAIRLCLQPPSLTEVHTTNEQVFTLLSLPFYLVGQIPRLVSEMARPEAKSGDS